MHFLILTRPSDLAKIRTSREYICCRIIVLTLGKNLLNKANKNLSRQLSELIDTGLSSSSLYLNRVPDSLLETVKKAVSQISETGFNRLEFNWSDLGEWGTTYALPTLREREDLATTFTEYVKHFESLIDIEISFRLEFRASLNFHSKIIRMLAQSIRDKMESEIGWTSYGQVSSWIKREGLVAFDHHFRDYQIPGNVRRYY